MKSLSKKLIIQCALKKYIKHLESLEPTDIISGTIQTAKEILKEQ